MAMQDELQAAFENSRINTDLHPDSAAIANLIKSGRFVLVYEYPIHCIHTDAFIGMGESIAGEYADRKFAEMKAEELNSEESQFSSETSFYVLPRLEKRVGQIVVEELGDIPF